ncbi:receptor activity-modifying protein 2 [Cyprinodon tularosa]|uniref:receptor activity-modifying protein 2 n=1 Tax=Cyprinodon tularosa TaxID=77115 RepID=UPI0018E260E3|nr:receptor activity-modifying protein 2 [Cyprinodon tularosa]
MNRAFFSSMTVTRFSLVFSVCLVTLLVWGCTTGICLVNDNVTAQPVTTATTTGYNATQRMDREVSEGGQLSFDCATKYYECDVYCSFCQDNFGNPTMDCLSLLYEHCLIMFKNEMSSLNTTDWCVWNKVSSFYSNFSHCSESMAECLLIPWPNSLVERFFVKIHSKFFKDCPTEEFSDPPPAVMFALVITPICLIPVMVSLVVLKTKNGDGNS